jgi:hypothetical protein
VVTVFYLKVLVSPRKKILYLKVLLLLLLLYLHLET